ncbi:MAG: hypothetical protein M3Z66_01760 [Chloroflexota bacterium]|nr:hypothetical protein [Chloroflexota bacterium]
MPKKVHNRPAKSKARPRRPVSRPSTAIPFDATQASDGVAEEGTGAMPLARPTGTSTGASPLARPGGTNTDASPLARPGGTSTGASPLARPGEDRGGTANAGRSRRGPASARRTPTLVVNYQYLRRDIRSLAVLAPTMIVLLVIAFFVLH